MAGSVCHLWPFAVILNGAKRSEESEFKKTETRLFEEPVLSNNEILLELSLSEKSEILRCAQNDM
jgi:hypothetical protein